MNNTNSKNIKSLGNWMHNLMLELYPICRSLAGPGNRESLFIIKKHIPIDILEVPSLKKVFDWTVPKEWSPKEAWIVDPNGKKRAVFSNNNLNLVSHSVPKNEEMDLSELLPHLYSLPAQPNVIPYVTSYYKEDWGFCMSEAEKKSLPKGKYQVFIDSKLEIGSMSLGEFLLPGESKKEILISTYICHPSMANDNLSGVVVAIGLYRLISQLKYRKYSYRFLFIPETIGSIAWLFHQDEHEIKERVIAGLVLSCIGNEGLFNWKKTRHGNSLIDRVVQLILKSSGVCMDFSPETGSDERQFCSPGFDMKIGLLSRSYPGTFSSYHTSADTPDKTPPNALEGSVDCLFNICMGMEVENIKYQRINPYGEPMLSKRGLYNNISIKKEEGIINSSDIRAHLMWVLNFSDGDHTLLDIAEKSGLDLNLLYKAAESATEANVLKKLLVSDID
jgi:aminopeptidase-like protein